MMTLTCFQWHDFKKSHWSEWTGHSHRETAGGKGEERRKREMFPFFFL